jgi:hypothetical protein
LPSNGTEIPYVRPLKINRETDSFDTLDEIPDSLPWDDEEGRWLAGIGIHLEPGGRNSYPKTEFTIQLRFTLQDQRCELQVASYLAEKKLELTADDASSWKAAIEYIITVLVRGFKLEPWEAYPAEKQKIGFTWTDRN